MSAPLTPADHAALDLTVRRARETGAEFCPIPTEILARLAEDAARLLKAREGLNGIDEPIPERPLRMTVSECDRPEFVAWQRRQGQAWKTLRDALAAQVPS